MSFIDSPNDSSLVSTPAHKFDTPKSVFFNIGKRALDRDNIFKEYRADQKMKLSVSKLSDQQVISSQTYQQLLQKFQKLLQQKQGLQQKRPQNQRLARIEQKIKLSKQQIHGHKYIIWELKNEVMSLQQEISNEINQYNYLHECLMDENENQQPDSEDFDNNQGPQNQDNDQYSGTNVYMLRSHNQNDGQNEHLVPHTEIGRSLFDDKQIFGCNGQDENEQEPEYDEQIGDQKQQGQQETQMNQLSRMYGGGMIKRISLCSQL